MQRFKNICKTIYIFNLEIDKYIFILLIIACKQICMEKISLPIIQ